MAMSHGDGPDRANAEESSLLREQIEYYDVRAGEYDRDLTAAGRYSRKAGEEDLQGRDIEQARLALERIDIKGDALELAPGTGWWTDYLSRRAASVTAVDASEAMTEINRQRVGRENVRYVKADLFTWLPDGRYDFIFFAFWLSHVPGPRFESFWRTVDEALAPGGTVFFIDEHVGAASTKEEEWTEEQEVSLRPSADGRSYRVVKVFLDPTDLQDRLAKLGWEFEFGTRFREVFWAVGGRRQE